MFKGGMVSMMQKAQKMQQNISQAKDEIKELSATGTSGDKVKIIINGKYQVQSIDINDKVMSNKELLIAELTIAINDANNQITSESAKKIKEATGGLNLPF